MSHVQSITNSTYPYRGTLLRLDANGDGVLSREEIAADQRPGIMATSTDDIASDGTNVALGNLIAKLIQLPTSGTTDAATDRTPLGAAASGDADSDAGTQAAADLYRGTYGQYEMDEMAA